MLLTVRDAAERLGVDKNTLYGLISAGQLRVVNVNPAGRRMRLRVRLDDLQAFVDANTHDPVQPPSAEALDAAAH